MSNKITINLLTENEMQLVCGGEMIKIKCPNTPECTPCVPCPKPEVLSCPDVEATKMVSIEELQKLEVNFMLVTYGSKMVHNNGTVISLF